MKWNRKLSFKTFALRIQNIYIYNNENNDNMMNDVKKYDDDDIVLKAHRYLYSSWSKFKLNITPKHQRIQLKHTSFYLIFPEIFFYFPLLLPSVEHFCRSGREAKTNKIKKNGNCWRGRYSHVKNRECNEIFLNWVSFPLKNIFSYVWNTFFIICFRRVIISLVRSSICFNLSNSQPQPWFLDCYGQHGFGTRLGIRKKNNLILVRYPN